MSTQTLSSLDIDPGFRYREDYGDLESLKKSILSRGLIQPIAVIDKKGLTPDDLKELGETDPSLPYILAAGGRRHRAITELSGGKGLPIPARVYSEKLTALDLREIELAENIERKDFTLEERVKAIAEIHRLRQEKYGARIDRGNRGGEATGVSAKDTAEFLGKSEATVSQALKISRAIDEDPSIAEAKTVKEALKKIRKKEESALNRELAKRAEARLKEKGKVVSIKDKLIAAYRLQDCLEGMRQLPAETFDFIDLDPPFAINMKGNKKSRPNLAAFKDIDPNDFLPFMAEVMDEVYRVMKPHSWGIMWYAIEPWHPALLKLIRDLGLTCNGVPIIWDKTWGHGENVQYNLTNSYEPAFYFRKGTPKIVIEGHPATYTYGNVRGNLRRHQTQKPVELQKEILSTFTRPDSFILSPFAGSGTILEAAITSNRHAIGFDISEQYRADYIAHVQATY